MLSLFFIDKVKNYREYDESGNPFHGKFAQWFEEIYKTEIAKIYKHSGWNPEKGAFVNAPKPIEWVKVHNLPDHVYFNHSQHVKVGGIACQTCHGNIQEMEAIYKQAAQK